MDLTDSIGKIDLQGPMSGKILKKVLLKPEAVLEEMSYLLCRFNSFIASCMESFTLMDITGELIQVLTNMGISP